MLGKVANHILKYIFSKDNTVDLTWKKSTHSFTYCILLYYTFRANKKYLLPDGFLS